MHFKFLGTGAAEGVPAMFCSCETCEKAKKSGGKNLRSRSQAVIDGKLLIDLPPDTFMHTFHGDLDMSKISHCLITHNHSDHLYASDLEMRRKGFAYLKEQTPPLTLYATEPSFLEIKQILNKYELENQERVYAKKIEAFKPFTFENYIVTPLKADHDTKCMAVFYLIYDGNKTIMYANDTGYFPEETWDYLKKNKPYINFVSLDCTAGIQTCRNNHMSFDINLEVRNMLELIGCTDSKTIFYSNHFSHNGILTYDDLFPIAEKNSFKVSYDGLEIFI